MSMTLYDMIQESSEFVRARTTVPLPTIGVVLGTGLGGLTAALAGKQEFDYTELPYFPVSTVESHSGRLVFGSLDGCSVAVLQGRFHRYEGYTLQDVTFPIRVLRGLGVRTLIVTNACGGMNPLYRRGDIMIIDDHINLLGDSPLIGPNDDRLGPRFPDMSEPYSQRLISFAEQAALELQHKVHRGVYVAVAGPNLETRAEYRFLRTIGADVVGMSTVPETIVARHMNMEVLGLSIITDECFPDSLQPVTLDDVIAAAKKAEPVMTQIIRKVISRLAIVILAILGITACQPEEPLINNFDGKWRLLASGPAGLFTVAMPEGVWQGPAWTPTSATAPYPVSRIVEFRDEIFLLMRDPQIVVLDRSTFAVRATIDLGANGAAGGIAFANATTAYVSLPSSMNVGIVDLTVDQLVSTIQIGHTTSDITAVGNQICVLLPETREAKVIDSRTNTVEGTVVLPTDAPILVGGDGPSSVFCVVAKGAGKDSGSVEPKTSPTLTSIDVLTRRITATVPLTARDSEGPQQIPMGLAINANGYCFVPVQNGLLQASTRSPRRAAAIQFDAYSAVAYDASRARVLCVRNGGRDVDVFDEYAENKIGSVSLPDSVNAVLGLAP